eukprot:331355_1
MAPSPVKKKREDQSAYNNANDANLRVEDKDMNTCDKAAVVVNEEEVIGNEEDEPKPDHDLRLNEEHLKQEHPKQTQTQNTVFHPTEVQLAQALKNGIEPLRSSADLRGANLRLNLTRPSSGLNPYAPDYQANQSMSSFHRGGIGQNTVNRSDHIKTRGSRSVLYETESKWDGSELFDENMRDKSTSLESKWGGNKK